MKKKVMLLIALPIITILIVIPLIFGSFQNNSEVKKAVNYFKELTNLGETTAPSNPLLLRNTSYSSPYSTVTDNQDGTKTAIIYTSPIAYQKNGTYYAINTSIYETDVEFKGDTYSYMNDRGIYEVYFDNDSAKTGIRKGKYGMVQTPIAVGWYDETTKNWSILQTIQNSNPIVENNTVTYPNSFYKTNISYEYNEGKFKEIVTVSEEARDYIVDNYFPVPNPQNKWFVIANKLEFYNLNINSSINVTKQGILEFLDNDTNALAFFFPISQSWDSNGSVYDVEWRVIKYNGDWYLLYGMPLTWFNDKVFPVYIDPTTKIAPTLDGYIYKLSTSWNTARNSATGTSASSTATYKAEAISAYKSGAIYYVYRSFISFDTSSIPDDATIDDAVIYIYGYSKGDTSVVLQKGTQGDSLTSADFDAFSGSPFNITSSWSAGAWNSLSLNQAGLDNISKTAKSYYCLREETKDYDDVQPAGLNQKNGMYYEEHSGSVDPYFNVTYTEANKNTTIDSAYAVKDGICETNNLYWNMTCLDSDDTNLTAYYQIYNDTTPFTNGSVSMTNNTEATIYTLGSGNISAGETWVGELWCGDGEFNTSKTNYSARVTECTWWNSSFQYCRNLTVNNAYRDYPYQVNLTNTTNMENSSLRFINAPCYEGGIRLDHWIENATANWIDVWFESRVSRTDFSVYYNNTATTSLTNCSATFLLCDDFDTGASIDTSIWKNDTANTTISNGMLEIRGKPGDDTIIETILNFTPPHITHVRGYSDTETVLGNRMGSGHGIGSGSAQPYEGAIFYVSGAAAQGFALTVTDGGNNNVDTDIDFNLTDMTEMMFKHNGSNVTFYGDGILQATSDGSETPTDDTGIWFRSVDNTNNLTIDFAFKRRFENMTEPTVTIGNQFFNGSVAGGGDTCNCSSIQAGTIIDCTENCDISACDAYGQNVTLNGSGTITTSGDVTNISRTDIKNGCKLVIGTGFKWELS